MEEEVSAYLPSDNASVTDSDLKYRIEEEGFGYTIQHYYRFSDIKSKETRELFGKAYDAMNDLFKHLGVEK